MTLARWLCAVACCIAVLSACKGGDDDDSASGGSSAKDAGKSDDRDGSGSGGKGSSGKGGSNAGGGGKSGSSASGSDAGGDRDAATEMMSDAASESGGEGGASGGGGTRGSSGIGAIEHDPDRCAGAICPEPSVCDRDSDPPTCVCPEGFHYVDLGGGASPCAMDCEGADCDAGS